MKTFRQWLSEVAAGAGNVDSDPNNANPAFGIRGVNSKYHQREAPNAPSSFDPKKLFIGDDENEEDDEEEEEEEFPLQPSKKSLIVP